MPRTRSESGSSRCASEQALGRGDGCSFDPRLQVEHQSFERRWARVRAGRCARPGPEVRLRVIPRRVRRAVGRAFPPLPRRGGARQGGPAGGLRCSAGRGTCWSGGAAARRGVGCEARRTRRRRSRRVAPGVPVSAVLPHGAAFQRAEQLARDERFFVKSIDWPDVFDPTFPYGDGGHAAVAGLSQPPQRGLGGGDLRSDAVALSGDLGRESVVDASSGCTTRAGT